MEALSRARARAPTARSSGRTPRSRASSALHADRRARAARDRLAPGRRAPRRRGRRAERAARDPVGLRLDAEPLPAAGLVRRRHGARRLGDAAPSSARLYRDWPFFRALLENLEMTLAKSSLEIARATSRSSPPEPDPERLFAPIAAEHAPRGRGGARVVEASAAARPPPARAALDRAAQPLRRPDERDPGRAARRHRAGDETALRPLLARSRALRRRCATPASGEAGDAAPARARGRSGCLARRAPGSTA